MLILPLFVVGLVSSLASGQSPMNHTCVHGKYPPPPSYQIKEYVINLDLPPEQRWQQVAQEKQRAIAGIILEFRKFLMEWGSGEIITLIELLGDNIDDALQSPYKEELRGMANASGIAVGELFVYNIFYELFSVCTSIVAHDKDGKMFHARNLDFGLFLGWDTKNKSWELTGALRPALINLDWQKGGKTVFKSVNYAGYIGVLTAVKQGKFTFSMDERFVADGGYLGILEWIRDRKGSWMGFLSRETMETAVSFDQARDKLANTQMIAPAYFILGGTKPGEGVIITRNREVNGTDIWPMTDKSAGSWYVLETNYDQWNEEVYLHIRHDIVFVGRQKGVIITRNREVNGTDIWPMTDKSAGGWYVLETNYDHWKAPFFLDDRRDPANKCMQEMTISNVGIPGLFDVLSSKPVLNKLTTYSALMQVDSGHLESWLQYCPDPCDPW